MWLAAIAFLKFSAIEPLVPPTNDVKMPTYSKALFVVSIVNLTDIRCVLLVASLVAEMLLAIQMI